MLPLQQVNRVGRCEDSPPLTSGTLTTCPRASGAASIHRAEGDTEPDGITSTYFLNLQLFSSSGELLSRNFYWLSTKADVLDYPRTFDTVYTPEKSFGDLTALQKLTPVKLTWTSKFTPDSVTAANAMAADGSAAADTSAHESATEVRITNPSASIAFLVRL